MKKTNRLILSIIFALSILFLVLCSNPLYVNAGLFTICRDPSWTPLRFLAYPASEIYQYDFSPKPQVGGGIYGNFLVADGVWTGPTGIQINNVWHYVDWTTPYCDFSAPEPDGWKPGAPTILMEWKDITTDCALVDIDNQDGGWSWVEHRVNGELTRVLLHYGENLTGGHHQSLETKDYRLVESACYE
jgi:hypothetical protein